MTITVTLRDDNCELHTGTYSTNKVEVAIQRCLDTIPEENKRNFDWNSDVMEVNIQLEK